MQYYLPSHLLSSWTYCNFFSSAKLYLLIRLTACIFTAVFSALWFRSLVWMSFKVQNLFRSWSWQRTIISQHWYLFMESQPWNLHNIVMAALTAPIFRTWSTISDLQECLFEPSMIKSKKLHICKRRGRRIASVYHADNSP